MRSLSLGAPSAALLTAALGTGCGDSDPSPGALEGDVGVPAPQSVSEAAPTAEAVASCVPDETQPVARDRCTTDPADTTRPACERWVKVEAAGATCSDGSPYKFFVNLTHRSNNLVLMFEPGGACWDFETCSGKARGAVNPRGVPDDHMGRYAFLNLLRRDATNPVQDWNMVFVSYCTGDVHAGRRIATYDDPTGGPPLVYRHVGHDNTLSVLDWLAARFTNVPKLLVTGCSAGGIGALQNYAYVRERLPGAQCGYLLNDSGPAFHSDGPSGRQHAQVRAAWGSDAVIDELAGKLRVDATKLREDFGLLSTAVADRFPRDRLSLAVYQLDLNYSLYAYERFYPGATLADIQTLWSKELGDLLTSYDSRSNLSYYVPYFRRDNCSHCASIPPLGRDTATILATPWLGSEIEQHGISLRDYTELLLDDRRPLTRYREQPQPEERFTMEEAAACMKPN